MEKVMEVDVSTGKVTQRDLTANELDLQESSRVETLAREAEQEAIATKKLAIYKKLGLTQNEINILLS
jgi:hypothetical protein